MAKRKHAAALFEVFHDNRGLDQRAPASRSPRWWFKSRTESDSQTPSDPNDPTTATIKSPLIAPRIAAVEAMEPKPAPVAPPPARPQPVAAPTVPPITPEPTRTTAAAAVAAESPAATGAVAAAPQPTQRFHFDREGKELTLRVRLTHAIAAGFGVLLIVGLAYVQGRRATAPAEAASAPVDPAPIAAEVPARSVQASALDLPRRPNHPPVIPKPGPATPEPKAHERETGPIANSVHGLSPVPPPATPAPPAVPEDRRMTGLNYVIVQSYPDQAGAIEARNFLLKNGVACTVEKAPPGWVDATWSSVITIRGFERDQLHTAACENLIKQIEKLSDKFAGGGKFKKFEPHLYRWK